MIAPVLSDDEARMVIDELRNGAMSAIGMRLAERARALTILADRLERKLLAVAPICWRPRGSLSDLEAWVDAQVTAGPA